jgi:peroxiredoxin Q/BCP
MKRLNLILIALAAFGGAALASEQPAVGQPAPEFELSDQDGQLHSLEDYRDQWVVLYFYPKDETPGCTTEACEFRDNIFAFKKINTQILGVSLDDAESHKKFAENHGLPFPLLADVEGRASEAYGVKARKLGFSYAKRQTFVIDPDGNLAKHYETVDPATHSKQLLLDLQELGASAEPSAAL